MSPVFFTLTSSISTDSVISTAVILAFIHLYLHDYFFTTQVTDRLTGVLSFSAAVAACTLLASRMPSPESTFAYIVLCLALFLFSPYVRRLVHRASFSLHVVLTALLCLAPLVLILRRSLSAGVLLGLAYLFIAGFCPLAFTSINKYKVIPTGPWDEAVLFGLDSPANADHRPEKSAFSRGAAESPSGARARPAGEKAVRNA